MTRKCYPHQIPCRNCGSLTMTRGTWVVCAECKEGKEERIQSKKHQDGRRKEEVYIVISDPDKEYGYRPGAIFYKGEIKCMTRPDNHSLSIGMILRNHDGDYRVVQLPTGRQELVKI